MNIGAIGTAVVSGKLKDLDSEGEAAPVATSEPAAAASDEVDLSVPYDAAARLAYEASGSPGDFETFKAKYEADAVAAVMAKQT